jgi:hypothetical protein
MGAALRGGALLATILSMSVSGSAAALTFVEAPGSPYSTTDQHWVPDSGGFLGGAVAGDFNGDGTSDLAVVNATGLPVFNSGESVTILLGHPDGELTMAPGSPVELYSGGMFASNGAIATGDFTNYGHLDLAVVDGIHETISILLGDGAGRFRLSGAPIPFSGGDPQDIAVGDFTGDGHEDLAFASGGNVNVLLGDGSGGFAPAPGSPFAVAGGPESVVAGHFNADGLSDLAVTTNSGQLAIYLAMGEGRFQEAAGSPLAAGESPRSMVATDLNGDGKADLAIADEGSDTVTVLLGDGSGGFAPALGSPFAVPGGPNASPSTPGLPDSIAAGDFNGDGNVDLAVANFNGSSDDVAVLQGDGHGGFTNAIGSPFPANGNPRPLVVGDFNGDGLPDLAVVNSFQGVVTVLDNTTHEGQEGPPSSPGPITSTPPPVTYPTVPTRAQILASLAQQPGPLGDWPRFRLPVMGKSYAFPFRALEAGTATVDWYAPSPARRHAWDAHAKPVLLASGRLTFSAAATGTMRIGFTKAGMILLKRTARMQLTAREAFTPTDSTTPIAVVRTVVLEERRAR